VVRDNYDLSNSIPNPYTEKFKKGIACFSGVNVMNDLSKVSNTDLVLEIYRRIKGESEMHDHLNYLYRAALRPIYTFFDKQNIDEVNIRSYQSPNWELLEASSK
jgi:hypothetical protein